jgi:hypothetical protein
MKKHFIIGVFICFSQLLHSKDAMPPGHNLIKFFENKGQVSDQNYNPRPDILFSAHDGDMLYHLKKTGISYQLSKVTSWKPNENRKTKNIIQQLPDSSLVYRLDIDWLNSNSFCEIEKNNPSADYNNYYLTSCPNGIINVHSYSDVKYKSLYNSIDLLYYNKEGNLKYDYIVHKGGDYKQIKLRINGAYDISVSSIGELQISTPLGLITEQAPLVIQNGKKLPAQWKVQGKIVSFNIDNIDPTKTFVIDPLVRLWGSYYGGNLEDQGFSCNTDVAGNVYLSGNTVSSTTTLIATSGSHQTSIGGAGIADGFLAKFTASGIRLWGTYYGGALGDNCLASTVDQVGNIYIAGETFSPSGISTPGSHQPIFGGAGSDLDAFLVKFNSSGFRIWGTYYGGTNNEQVNFCRSDNFGNIYFGGYTSTTTSTIISTIGTHQQVMAGVNDAYVAKFDTGGVRIWGTYYGGASDDQGNDCIVDGIGNVYLVGSTTTSGGTLIATPASHQPVYVGPKDGFIAKLNPSGQRLWGTYYGGNGGGIEESIFACAIDNNYNLYVVGETDTNTGNAIATPGAFQTTLVGFTDSFLAKFDSAGSRIWGTYYGGTWYSGAYACTVDNSGFPYLGGYTGAANGYPTAGSPQTTYGGGNWDGYFAKFDPSGNRQWGTLLGGSGDEGIEYCHINASGDIYLAGTTSSTNAITTTGCHQPFYGGGIYDSFLEKYKECPSLISITSSTLIVCTGQPATLTANGGSSYLWGSGATTPTIVVTPTTATTYSLTGVTGTCTLSTTYNLFTTPSPTITISASSGTNICYYGSTAFIANGGNTYTWSTGNTGSSIGISNPTASAVYTLTSTAANNCLGTATIGLNVIFAPTVAVVSTSSILCTGQTATLTGYGATSYTWSTSSNSASIVVTPTASTSYSLTGTNGCGTNSTSFTQSVSTCTYIKTSEENSELNIYPNPTSSKLIIHYGSSLINFEIYNSLGQKITAPYLLKENEIEIDLGDYTSGIYFIKVGNLNKKVIKE